MPNEADLRSLICEIGRRMYMRNLVAATDGNISVRLDAGRFLCTPSNCSKGFMRPEDIVVADARGEKVSGAGRVTSEFFTHLAAHEERPDITAVVHAHPPMATALMVAGLGLEEPVLPEVVMALGAIPTAPYATPGSREGADAIRVLIRSHDAILLDRHGALTLGATLIDAYHRIEKVEHAAEILMAARAIGAPRLLDASQIARLKQSGAHYSAS